MSVVVCKDLVKQFGAALAVDHVNIEIDDGEFMVFVGPSGCGKTTTLKAISGLLKPEDGEVTDGSIEFKDQRIDDLDASEIVRNGIDFNIFAQIYASDGTPVGANFRVSEETGHTSQYRPDVAIDEEDIVQAVSVAVTDTVVTMDVI